MAQDYDVTLKRPGLGVYGAVFYINEADRNKSLPSFFERRILGKTRNYYEFDVIKIWELEAETILRQKITGLLSLVPLMKYNPKLIKKFARKVSQKVERKVERKVEQRGNFRVLFGQFWLS